MIDFIFFLGFRWEKIAPMANVSVATSLTVKDTGSDALQDDDECEIDVIVAGEESPVGDDEELSEISRDQIFLANLSYLLESRETDANCSLVPAEDNTNSNTPKGFIGLIRQGVRYLVRKSSLLWMLHSNSDKTSTDRLYRFVNNSKKQKADTIMCGDFVGMQTNVGEKLFQVLGFKYSTGKGTFKGISCPIKPPEDATKARGVEVLVNFLAFDELSKEITFPNRAQKYINIIHYKRHYQVQRNNVTNSLTIVPKNL